MPSRAKQHLSHTSHKFFPQGEIEEVELRARRQGYTSAAEYLLDLHRQATEADPAVEFTTKQPPKPQTAFRTDLGMIVLGESHAYLTNNVKDESVDLHHDKPAVWVGSQKGLRYRAAESLIDQGLARLLRIIASGQFDVRGLLRPSS